MRTLAIANRIIKEIRRDKRTLALMFIAPVLIIMLMSFLFTASTATEVQIGVVNVPTKMNQTLAATKQVTVKHYQTKQQAQKALKQAQIDSVISQKANHYQLTYANTDTAKTAAVKMAVKAAMTKQTMTGLQTQLAQANLMLSRLKQQLPTGTSNQPTTNRNAQQSIKITNHYLYGDADTGFFDTILPILTGFFVFFFVFLISGMGLLKERTSGTLDRVLATPVKRSEIVFGYMLSYGILAIIQTCIIILVTIWLLGVEVVGNIFSLVIINLLLALVALAFGILLSTFASSEFQMMQFIPVVVIPQVFFSGIIPLDSMAAWVKAIAYVMPLKYSGDASAAIIMKGTALSALGGDILALLVFLGILTILNIVGLRRYRKV